MTNCQICNPADTDDCEICPTCRLEREMEIMENMKKERKRPYRRALPITMPTSETSVKSGSKASLDPMNLLQEDHSTDHLQPHYLRKLALKAVAQGLKGALSTAIANDVSGGELEWLLNFANRFWVASWQWTEDDPQLWNLLKELKKMKCMQESLTFVDNTAINCLAKTAMKRRKMNE